MTNDIEELYDDAMGAIADEEIDDAISILDELLDRAPNDPRTIEVQGDLARFLDEPEDAERHYRRLLLDAPDGLWRGIAHMSLGALFAETGSADAVIDHFCTARESFESAGEARNAVEACVTLACFQQESGNFENAVEALLAGETLISSSDDPEEMDSEAASVLQMLGTCYRLQGRMENATETLNRALRLFQKLEEPNECADTLDALGVIGQIQGQYDTAEELHLKAVTINETIHHEEGLSVNYGNLTILNIHRKDFDAAAMWAEKAYEIDRVHENENGIAHFHLLMGEIEAERGSFTAAEDHLTLCQQMYSENGDAEDEMCVAGKLAVLRRLQGRNDEAAEINLRILTIAEEMGHADGIGAILDELGCVRAAQGRKDEAREYWTRALKVLDELNSERMIREVRQQLADL